MLWLPLTYTCTSTVYMYFCRLMRGRIKVADPRIYLGSAAYIHIREEVVDEYPPSPSGQQRNNSSRGSPPRPSGQQRNNSSRGSPPRPSGQQRNNSSRGNPPRPSGQQRNNSSRGSPPRPSGQQRNNSRGSRPKGRVGGS